MATTFIINECLQNKGVFPRESVTTSCQMAYLERQKTAGATNLVLCRFSPIDYAVQLTGPVNCPFAGCLFTTSRGLEMSHHEETSAHPGWHRLGEQAPKRSWVCSFQGCGSSFFKWDNLYHHDVALKAAHLPGMPISNGPRNKTATTHRKEPSRKHISAKSPFLKTADWMGSDGRMIIPEPYPLLGA